MTPHWYQLVAENGAFMGSATRVFLYPEAIVDDFRDAVKEKNADGLLKGISPAQLTVYENKDAYGNRDNSLTPGTSLSGNIGQDENNALLVVVPNKTQGIEIGDISGRRTSFSKNLVDTFGSDFAFSDRERSFKILCDCLCERYKSLVQKKSDRNLHPIPFLADGPGSGKSRFLQELPGSFMEFVSSSEYPSDFKEAISSAIYINITFGNGSIYDPKEIQLGIETSLCLRILYQFNQSVYRNFQSFYDSHKHDEISLAAILEKLTLNGSTIVLGVDEVNQIHECDENQFKRLFAIVGTFSCSFMPFFVPVLAGTVIGPMKSVISKSTHPPLHIPLPLLSFESCLEIIAKKNPKYLMPVRTNNQLRQVISDVGGHCRTLEILGVGLEKFNDNMTTYWDDVAGYVRHELLQRYSIASLPAFGHAIAKSFLSIPVNRESKVSELFPHTFMDLEENGLIKLEDIPNLAKSKLSVPFFFIWCYLQSTNDIFSVFWTDVLIGNDMWWQDWEVFNRNYIAFRLSLYSYLGFSTISLHQFFKGAKISILIEKLIKIPNASDIKVSKITYRYPITKAPDFNIGDSTLNGDGAPFDSFLFVETVSNQRLLVALQMKLGKQDSSNPQTITDNIVNDEYNKINNSISNSIPGSDFICVLLGRCEGTFSEVKLPSKCVVVSKSEHEAFYGQTYFQRLNIL